MEMEIYKKGTYTVLRIKEDVGLHTDLGVLKSVIEKQVAKGEQNIAVAFTQQSYLYTKSIAVLISCSEIIKDANGHLAILEANNDILDIMAVIDFDKMIILYKSEEDLVAGITSNTQFKRY
jgi:anti-anti-sigma regulatory factor